MTTDAPALNLMTLNAWGLPFPLAWWRRGPRFERIRALLPLDALHFPLASGDTGLGARTRLPVLDRLEHRFARAVGSDRLVRKGVLGLRLDLAGGLWALNTHLQAGISAAARAVRSEQIDEIVRLLDGLDGPAVLMGDLNLYDEDAAAVARLEEAGLRDAATEADTLAHTPRWEAARLDRILLRDGGGTTLRIEALQVIDDLASGGALSDHHAVSARIRLE